MDVVFWREEGSVSAPLRGCRWVLRWVSVSLTRLWVRSGQRRRAR